MDENHVEFTKKLSALVSKELVEADADTIGMVLERLLHSAAFTISIASKGNPKVIEDLAAGSDAYLIETAAYLAPFGKLMMPTGGS